MDSYEVLCHRIVLEQFKNSVPENVLYITENKVKTAVFADDNRLTHLTCSATHRNHGNDGWREDFKFRSVGVHVPVQTNVINVPGKDGKFNSTLM